MRRRIVEFIDTSAILEVLSVPGHSGNLEDAPGLLAEKARAGSLVLPIATVIETGNHICQVEDGHARRTCAQKFSKLLELTASQEAPWVLNEVSWDARLIGELVRGAGTSADLIEHATRRHLGTGDLSVLVEAREYLRRVDRKIIELRLWSLDVTLLSYWGGAGF